MYDVEFKGQSTRDYKLFTKDIGRRKKSEEIIEIDDIPLRSGSLVTHTGKYKSYTRQMRFVSEDPNELPHIYNWLDGYGKLKTEHDEGGFFLASVVGGVDRKPDGPFLNELTIEFFVEPFFYLDNGDELHTFSEPFTFYNLGAIESEPFIKIYGNGEIVLNVNSQFVRLKNVVESITMDTKRKICFRDTLNEGRKMQGEYITFKKGENNVTWTGEVSKIEVIPRWCDK